MNPRLVLVCRLSVALALGGCAAASSDESVPSDPPGPAGKKHASGDLGKTRQDIAQDTVPSADQTKNAKGPAVAAIATDAPKKSDPCPPDKAVARRPAKVSPKTKPVAAGVAAAPKKAPQDPPTAEAALAKAVAEEKAFEETMRRRYGVSAELDLRTLLSPEETKEAARLHAITEAARLRLGLAQKAPRPGASDPASLSLKGTGERPPATPSDNATANLPAVPPAVAPTGTKTPSALHLSDWFTDEKAHQAWREKQLAKLAEAKEASAPAPDAK